MSAEQAFVFDCEHCGDGDALRNGEACAYCAYVKDGGGAIYERCDYCGEARAPFEFQDGLRCVYCAEADDKT